jgi:putative methionine-R-sulfoxide reductase with GAF domain
MKETTCKKLQEIGGFALAGGCTRKRMKQLVEMIRAARDYRWVGVYKIIKNIVPMRNDHRHVLGMLDAESDKLNAFDDEDLQFLERAGGLIAHCLH